MSKLLYLLKRLKSVNFNSLFKIAKRISKKANKAPLLIIIDMLYSVIRYGAAFYDYEEFEFYLLNLKERKTYLTSAINNKIFKKYNDQNYLKYFSDKILFNNHFKPYLKREFCDIRSKADYLNFINKHESFIAKPLDDCGGSGIKIYHKDEVSYEELINNRQYLIEEIIKQDKRMAKLYPLSVNCLRLITFVTDQKEVIILKEIIKLGNGGRLDNFASGGMYSFIENGKIAYPFIDKNDDVYSFHPYTKENLLNYPIPNYDEVIKLVKELALVIPKVRYVGWDIAISDNGPCVIEGNEYSGIFQVKVSLSGKRHGDYELYHKYMDF